MNRGLLLLLILIALRLDYGSLRYDVVIVLQYGVLIHEQSN